MISVKLSRISVFGGVNGFLLVVFFTAALLQWNDPDPLQWFLIYGLAGLCAYQAQSKVSPLLTSCVLLLCLWMLQCLMPQVRVEDVDFKALANSFSMVSNSIEVFRELAGLLLVACWMLYLLTRYFWPPDAGK